MTAVAEAPTFELVTPFGRVNVSLLSDHEARLADGSPSDPNQDGIVVNRVPYRLNLNLLRGSAGWWTRGSEFLTRADRPSQFRADQPSRAAEARVERELLAIFCAWAEQHPGTLVEARRHWLLRHRSNAETSVRLAEQRLCEAQGQMAELDAMLAALPAPTPFGEPEAEDPDAF